MTSLGGSFKDVAAFVPESFKALQKHILPEWLDDALAQTKGFATLRRRKLPVDRALWLVIGMALFRDRSISAVVNHLGLVLPKGAKGAGLASSAIPLARARLGVAPLERLLELTGEAWGRKEAELDSWRGLKIFGCDGTCMRVPDSVENDATFGRPGSARSEAGYPQVRVATLMALASHVLVGMSVGGIHEGELSLAERLWKTLPNNSLTILDRGYVSFWVFHQLAGASPKENRHWMVRFSQKLSWRPVKKLGDGDEIVEFEPSAALRRAHPGMPQTLVARMVRTKVKGFRETTVLTSLLDPVALPASELGTMYRLRWELEVGFDEIKTHMLNREESLRSRTPDGIRQELAGIGVAYNLVRVEMARVARELGISPTRISFLNSLQMIQMFLLQSWGVPPSKLPRQLGDLDRHLELLVLPKRRTHRRAPRHVKITTSSYPKNHGRTARVMAK